jgi:hypothetical protein
MVGVLAGITDDGLGVPDRVPADPAGAGPGLLECGADPDLRVGVPTGSHTQRGVAMTTFAQHRATVESFVDCMHGGADKDALARVLAENVVLVSPLSDEPLTGRDAVTAAIQGVSTVAADLTYKEVLSGETHHAAFFRLQIEDTAVNGMDYILLDADGKIAEVTIFWRPLPSAVEMQGHLAPLVGMQPWEMRTKGE